MVKNIIIISSLFLLQASCSRNNSLKEASQKLCECFKNYSEDDSEKMLNTVQLIDSLDVNLNDFPKQQLLSQLDKDCPKVVSVIQNLSD